MIKKTVTVVITGKPNVGKSTLLNSIASKEVAIVTHKPQTTRNQINYKYSDNSCDINFMDTPGYHKPNNKLDMFLNSQIKNAYKLADVALLVIDLAREINDEDLTVIKLVQGFNVDKIILVLNKVDVVMNKDTIKEYEEKIKSLIKVDDVICISAKSRKIESVISTIKQYLSDTIISLDETNGDKFIISEIIREQLIINFKQEIPYAVCVSVNSLSYDKNENQLKIQADIIVEKDSQKPIIIGSNGVMIKKIGSDSRRKLLTIYDCRVDLRLFVVVKKLWRDNDLSLKNFGYK